MKMVLVRSGRGLLPADEHSEDILRGIPHEAQIIADVKVPRNARQLRFIHVLLRKVADNHPDFVSVEALKRELKIRARMFDPIVGANGQLFYTLRSIAFEEMDQAEFAQVWEQWRRIIVTEIVPGMSDAGLQREILEAL